MVKIELTDAGLIELENIIKQLDKTPFADTLIANLKLDRQLQEQDERMYVPEEVGLVDSGTGSSIGIMSPLGQCLFKSKCVDGFSVAHGWISDNTGDNFYYKKVDIPEAGKLHYVYDNHKNYSTLLNYKLYLTDKCYCYLNQFGMSNLYHIRIDNFMWRNYYEIVKV